MQSPNDIIGKMYWIKEGHPIPIIDWVESGYEVTHPPVYQGEEETHLTLVSGQHIYWKTREEWYKIMKPQEEE